MIVLGADTHKRSHTIAAVAAATGELLGERTVPVGWRGFDALLVWARSLDGERVWALEDCRHVSGSLERFLIGRGERVLRIPTHLSAGARKRARQRGKSDPIDALNVARAALQEGLDTFPAAHLDGPELDLRLLVDHRERLVRHRVELNSTLLWHLTICGPSCGCRVARCSRRNGRRGSAGGWPASSRRCACGSRATSCAACASSPRRSTSSRARSPNSSGRSRRSCSASRGSGR
jgi:transposase